MMSPRTANAPLLVIHTQSTVNSDAYGWPGIDPDPGIFEVIAGHLLGMLSVKRPSWCRKSGMPPAQSIIRPEIDS